MAQSFKQLIHNQIMYEKILYYVGFRNNYNIYYEIKDKEDFEFD